MDAGPNDAGNTSSSKTFDHRTPSKELRRSPRLTVRGNRDRGSRSPEIGPNYYREENQGGIIIIIIIINNNNNSSIIIINEFTGRTLKGH